MADELMCEDQDGAVNRKLEQLETVNLKIHTLQAEAAATKEQIRAQLTDCVVVFIDMVDSTSFKVDHAAEPEVWILRVKQFDELCAKYIQGLGGTVIKYIGDEVMGMFAGVSAAQDAGNLVCRVRDIEKDLAKVTGFETRVKMVVDKGPVYLLQIEGHAPLDPQGTAVDRCARISKFASPGTVLSTRDFVDVAGGGFLTWSELGSVNLRGLGNQTIYQLGKKSIELSVTREITEKEYEALSEQIQIVQKENQEIKLLLADAQVRNRELGVALAETGGEVPRESIPIAVADEKRAEEWGRITQLISTIKRLIASADVSATNYSRFLFLALRDETDVYNRFENKVFDDLIEKDIVVEEYDKSYSLNPSQPRNQALLELLETLDMALREYEDRFGREPGHLFTYTLRNADTWKELLGLSVQWGRSAR